MTQHQYATDTDSHAIPPSNGPVFGLGIATGVLAIFASTYVFDLAGLMTRIAVDGHPLVGLVAVLYGVLAVAALVLGILVTVRNRQRSSTLPLALLGIAVLVVVFSVAGTLTGLTGGAWWLFSTIGMFPLIVVALLAYLFARKTTP